MKKRKINLLYVLGAFPVLSQTFIQRELLEMSRDNGLDIKIISLHGRGPRATTPPELKSKVSYFNPGPLKLFTSNVLEFFRSPINYLSLVFLIFFGKHNRPSLKILDLGSLVIGASLSNEIRSLEINHIHTHFADWPTTVALVLSRFLDIPFSFTAHAHDIHMRQMLLKEKISSAKTVVTISRFNKDYLQGLASPKDKDKVVLNYLGVNFKDLHFSPRGKPNEVPLILAVGRLVPFKGFSYLVDALDLVKKRGEDFRAVIIGGGPEFKHLKQQITRKGLFENVQFLNALPFGEVRKYFEQADIFVAPSVIGPSGKFDGIPVVLFEAMGAKLPIVSTYVSGIPEAVQDGENGLLVKEKDAESLAEAISTLLNDQSLREKFGEAGFRRARKMFDLRKNVQQLKQVILGT